MRIRTVDYVGNLGGGTRFSIEVLKALSAKYPSSELELISHGRALLRYRDLVREAGIPVRLMEAPPRGRLLNRRYPRFLRSAIGPLAKKLASIAVKWHFDVPPEVLGECDVVWFPWMHWHRLPPAPMTRVVASFHDTIIFDIKDVVPNRAVQDEGATIRHWVSTPASIVVSSNATANRMAHLFGPAVARYDLVRLAADHGFGPASDPASLRWEWMNSPYLLYPSNTSRHKNHELLLSGLAAWGAKVPLILCGENSDLRSDGRGREIHAHLGRLGLRKDVDVRALGYVGDREYMQLLLHAWALVMPSLAEGGGSFPAWEALLAGVPVLCSDIPVMRELASWLQADMIWFNPRDPLSLANGLEELFGNYDEYRCRTKEQIPHLRHRKWTDVAQDYWRIFRG